MKEIIETIIASGLLLCMSSSMFIFAWWMLKEYLEDKWLPFLSFAIIIFTTGLLILAYLGVNLF